jgi:hypothetical protein
MYAWLQPLWSRRRAAALIGAAGRRRAMTADLRIRDSGVAVSQHGGRCPPHVKNDHRSTARSVDGSRRRRCAGYIGNHGGTGGMRDYG